MAAVRSRFDSVYYNGRKRYNFSQLRAKDMSKMRKRRSRTLDMRRRITSYRTLTMEEDTVRIQEPRLETQRSNDPCIKVFSFSGRVVN